jgi:hypothetical protein
MNKHNIVKYDKEGLWSLSHYDEAEKISNIILELVNNNLIIDCTSGLGGNTFSFSNHFKRVISVELDKNRFDMLTLNVNTNQLKNIKLYNENCINFLKIKCDAFFFDPPWGGPDYKLKKNVKLKLSNKSLFNHNKFFKSKDITRQIGCMGAIDFNSSKRSLKFLKDMLNDGYILEYGSENINTIVYCLPYIMKENDYNNFLNALHTNINDIK